ncbi:glycosyltransferase family 4 protein [Planktomarina sp.]|nr:glycosyltransferase family 4 protein [Planktomarina sp.]
MKILYIHQYYNTPEMQGSTRSYEFARRLANDGHEVIVITADRTENAPNRRVELGNFKVVWLGIKYNNRMGFISRLFAFLSFMLRASCEAIRFESDLVFATSTPLTVFIPGWIASIFCRAPLVFEVRDLWPEMPIAAGILKNRFLIRLLLWFESFVYRRCASVVALSEDMKASVEAKSPNVPVFCIPNSSDIELFDKVSTGEISEYRDKLGFKPTDIVLIYAGTLGFLNNVPYLLDLAEKSQCDRLKFLIIGEGADAEVIKTRISNSESLTQKVCYLGGISKIEVAIAVRSSNFGVSLFRPIGEMEKNSANKFFDYLAAGLPVIINYGGWQEKIIVTHNCGFKLSSDPALAAEELRQKIWTDPQQSIVMGRNSRRLAEENFARDLLYNKLLDVFIMVGR